MTSDPQTVTLGSGSERTKSALAVRREQGMNLGQAERKAAADKAREFTEDAIASKPNIYFCWVSMPFL
ncbi:MAG TPA: hypothetical protein V6D14_15390 [Coleofasciculaceae cyanobacterium]